MCTFGKFDTYQLLVKALLPLWVMALGWLQEMPLDWGVGAAGGVGGLHQHSTMLEVEEGGGQLG